MFKDIFKNYIYPVATLSGSIIGVGFLSLPYITLKVGLWPMLFYFALLTGLMLVIHLIFGQICLKTPDYKRFPGFVEFYLGKFPKIITLISIILGSFGVLLIYMIVGGQFLSAIAGSFFGGNATTYVVIYFLLGSFLIYFGVKTISKAEFWALALLLVAFLIIFMKEFSHLQLGNIFISNPTFFHDWRSMFLPYGIIIFSLWGTGLIPEVEEMLIGRKKLLKKVIVIGTLIPAAVYLVFIFLVLGISGSATTPVAITGLKNFLGAGMFLVAIAISIITTFTAFITQGLFLKKTFVYDMGIGEGLAWFLTCAPPLVLFLLGFTSFIGPISFIGGVLLGINGLLILLMYKKIGGRNMIIYPLALVFILGMVYEVVYFMK